MSQTTVSEVLCKIVEPWCEEKSLLNEFYTVTDNSIVIEFKNGYAEITAYSGVDATCWQGYNLVIVNKDNNEKNSTRIEVPMAKKDSRGKGWSISDYQLDLYNSNWYATTIKDFNKAINRILPNDIEVNK